VSLLVQKFGGTSVADSNKILAAARRAIQAHARGEQVLVVVSARGKTTDELISLAKEINEKPPAREMDMLLSTGEQVSVALMAMAVEALGVPAISFTGAQVGLVTDSFHSKARIRNISTERMQQALEAGKIVIVAGFQGVDENYNITTLGRGGSDTTAVALAKALGADACELYTDVSGVFTTDPRVVPEAKKMAKVSFDELLEMTSTGCPKPAMRSVEYAHRHGVTLHIRSAFTWEPGTWVTEEEPMEHAVVSAITHDVSEAKVTVAGVPDYPGVAARIFRALADEGVVVDTIVQNTSEAGVTDISFTVPHADLAVALATVDCLQEELGAVRVSGDPDIARVSVIGSGMRTNPGVAATMFETLAEAGINIDMISTSVIRTSCVVRQDQAERAVQVLHAAFELGAPY